MGRLLDRYDTMQRRPFGTNTALTDGNQNGTGGAAGSQFRRQEKAYGQALRLLNRRARRGDVGSALEAIRTRNSAMNEGYSVGGIRDNAQAEEGIANRVGAMNQANIMERTRINEEMEEAGGTSEPDPQRKNGTGTPKTTIINGREATFADNGDGIMAAAVTMHENTYGVKTAPRIATMSDEAVRRRNRVTALQDQWKYDATMKANAEGMGAKMAPAYEAQYGSPEEQMAEYDADFKASDDKIETAIANLDPKKFSPEQIAQIRANMKGIGAQGRKDAVAKGKEISDQKIAAATAKGAQAGAEVEAAYSRMDAAVARADEARKKRLGKDISPVIVGGEAIRQVGESDEQRAERERYERYGKPVTLLEAAKRRKKST